MNPDELLKRIVINPKVMVGKPVIDGTRVSVDMILRLLSQGIKTEDILRDYPHITKDDIHACLLFASKLLESPSFMPLETETA